MSYLILPKGTLLQIEAKDPLATPAVTTLQFNKVSEHNRSEFTQGSMRIENTQRMSNGTLRKHFVADKATFDVSWDLLPAYRAYTVDGYWGAEDLKTFYESAEGAGSFRIRINYAKDGTNQESSGYEEFTVVFTSFTSVLQKRGVQAHYNVSMSLEEV